MNVKDIFGVISTDECFGYSPSSSSTKPAHIANGWFRRLIGAAYDPVLLNETMMHWVASKEANRSEDLLEGHAGTFDAFVSEARLQDFVHFRADVRELLSPHGGAANRGNERSSYNITAKEHLTKDHADNSVGAFLFHLVNTAQFGATSPIVEMLVSILNDGSDEVSTLTLPLTRAVPQSPVNVASYPAPGVFRKTKDEFSSVCLRNLRQGFNQLAAYERIHGGGVEALRRAVAFGVFSVMLHMVNRSKELRKDKGLTPMLLYFQGRKRNTAYYASNQTYRDCRQAIEFTYTEKFREKIAGRIGESPTTKQCQTLIKQMEFGKVTEDEARRLEVGNLFTAYRSTEDDPIGALASATKDVVFRMMTGDPTEFYRGLGVRVGFIKPTGGTRKYFTLDGVLLGAC